MSGYKINPAEVSRISQEEDGYIQELGQVITELEAIGEDLLSDANWQGQKKKEFRTDFTAYLNAVRELKKSGDAQIDALLEVLSTYIKPEM